MRKRFLLAPVCALMLTASLSGVALADELENAPVSDIAPVEEVVEAPVVDSDKGSDKPALEEGGNDVVSDEAEPVEPQVPEEPEAVVPEVPVVSEDVTVPELSQDEPQATGEGTAANKPQAAKPYVASLATPADGWAREGGKTYYYKGGKRATGWLVVDTALDGTRGLERYWLGKDGALSTGLIDAGSGWWAYGISGKGYVVRGMYRDPITGYFYYADNDGRLLSPGWHVTSAFGQGLQRYYIDAKAHAAVPGTSVDGYRHFTRGDTGYVARGYTPTGDGTAYVADNDGRLANAGWLVANLDGRGLERYWISAEGKTTKGLINAGAGWFAYGKRDTASVVRGMYRDPITGYFYYADNNGRLLSPGWHVTSAFGQGLQRYYIDAKAHAAVPGTSADGYRHFTRGDTGYVARGKVNTGAGFFLADNDGRLANEGWLVTAAYDGVLQRYRVSANGQTPCGFFRVDGKAYYAIPALGYVVRGKHAVSGNGMSQMVLADNDGVMADFEGWLITDKYDGTLQRYRLDDSVVRGFYGAHIGFFMIDGQGYYGRNDQGYVARELYRAPSGEWFLGNNDGVLQKLPAKWMDMYMRAQKMSSATPYLVIVDTNNPRMGIYTYNRATRTWNVLREWVCSVGTYGTPTVRGSFTIQNRGYSFGSGFTAYYWTQFYGDYLVHSVLYEQGSFEPMDFRLGQHVSHGCIRLEINNAAWFNYNIPSGTKMFIY